MITYVVYSGEIKNSKDSYETGINEYRVKTIIMASTGLNEQEIDRI